MIRKQGRRGAGNSPALELKVPTAPPPRLLDRGRQTPRGLAVGGRIFNRPAGYRMMEAVCGALVLCRRKTNYGGTPAAGNANRRTMNITFTCPHCARDVRLDVAEDAGALGLPRMPRADPAAGWGDRGLAAVSVPGLPERRFVCPQGFSAAAGGGIGRCWGWLAARLVGATAGRSSRLPFCLPPHCLT